MWAKIAAGLAVALLASGGASYLLWGRWQAARDRADRAEARAEAQERAIGSLDAYLATMEAERDRWRQAAQELETVEGRDEPLNPYERAVLDRVRTP